MTRNYYKTIIPGLAIGAVGIGMIITKEWYNHSNKNSQNDDREELEQMVANSEAPIDYRDLPQNS